MKAKKIFIGILSAILLSLSAHAEFDDNIRLEVGSFCLDFGWGLTYTPETLDNSKAIFPLLKFVEENYDDLKTVKKYILSEIFKKSDQNGDFYELWVQESSEETFESVENADLKKYRVKSEAEAVQILLERVASCVKTVKPLKSKMLTLYLVARKFERESNEPSWTGEFARSTLSSQMTKDYYHYAFYFSREKAEEKARQNKGSIVRQVLFTKNTASIIDFSWETELEKTLGAFFSMQKVELVRYQYETERNHSGEIEKYDRTCAFVFRDNSSAELWVGETKGDEEYLWLDTVRIRVTGGNKCELLHKVDGSERVFYSIEFAQKNTVRVTDPLVKETFDDYKELRERYGMNGEYESDIFVLEAESYKKLKADLLEKSSLEAAVSFLSNSLYFLYKGTFYEILAPLGETYRIKNAVCWFNGGLGGMFYVLHIQYQYKNGVLSSLVAEDKDDYAGIIYQKTLVSDTATERVYKTKLDGYLENWSDATETFDKRTQVRTKVSETMNNHIWSEKLVQFPPETRYLTNDEVQHLLDGKE